MNTTTPQSGSAGVSPARSNDKRGTRRRDGGAPRLRRSILLAALGLILICVASEAQTNRLSVAPGAPVVLTATATNDLVSALQRGLFEEEGNRDLDAAISAYQSLAAQFDRSRQVAATAIFRLGECYRKLGRTNEAVAQYDRIVREFSDQQTLATLSRQNIAGLRQSPNLGDVSMLSGLGNASEEAGRLATQLNGIERLKDNSEEQARAVLAFFPDETLKKMLLQLPKLQEQETILKSNQQTNHAAQLEELELKIGGFHIAIGPDGFPPEGHSTSFLVDAQLELRKQYSWIKERVDFILGTQKARLKVLQTASGTEVANSATPSQAISPVTDDEEKEIRRIQELIQNSPDLINASRPGVDGGFPPLFSAARNGKLQVTTYLLDHGADVNLRYEGQTAQHAATHNGHKALVELLLKRGADVNAKDSGGRTALHWASQEGFQAVVETLLAHKANVEAGDNGGSTALQLAAERGNVPIVKMLTSAGANVNAEDASGRTALSYATLNGGIESVKTLLDAKADSNAGKLDAPLLCAVYKRNVETAELLLKAGANANAISENTFSAGLVDQRFIPNASPSAPGMGAAGPRTVKRQCATPLWLATLQGQLDMVKLLLHFKADPNDTQTDGQSVLFQALQNPDVLAALLDGGGRIDARLKSGIPLIGVASWGGDPNPAVVELLLKRGANPNAIDDNGNTPLHFVMTTEGSRNRRVIDLLFAYHADPNVQNKRGETPLDLAKTRFSGMGMPPDEAADLLRAHGALDNLPDFKSIRITRVGSDRPFTVFVRDTNSINRFTLLEVIRNFYRNPIDAREKPFPDFSKIIIHRPVPGKPGESKEITVNLLTVTNSFDCTKDTWLEFGDVVEIPEREHTLAEQAIGITEAQSTQLSQCLQGWAIFVVRGEKHEFRLDGSGYRCWLQLALGGVQNLLRSSSDLSHIKIKRTDPVTKATREIIADSKAPQQDNVWLRDGDVIEVPEKQ